MSWALRLRFVGMPWLAGAFTAAALMFASEQLPASADYALAVTSTAVASTALVAPLAASVAAWAAWRLRSAREATGAGVRPAWRIGAGIAGPIVLGAVVSLVATAVVRLALTGLSPLPDAGAVLVATFVVVGLTSAGFAVGTVLNGLVAAPLVMAASYVWLTLPLTMDTMWVRELTGMWLDCCMSDEQLRPSAVGAVVILYSAMTGAAIAVVRWRWVGPGDRNWAFVALGCAVLGAVVPSSMVVGTGPYPSQPRTSALTCTGTAVRVCVWPEHIDALPRLEATVTRVATGLDAIDAARPPMLSEANPASSRKGTGALVLVRGMSDQDMESSVAIAMAPALMPSCEQSLVTHPGGTQLLDDVARAQALVLARAGVADWRDRVGPELAAEVSRLLRRSDRAQGAWLTDVRGRALSCGGDRPDAG